MPLPATVLASVDMLRQPDQTEDGKMAKMRAVQVSKAGGALELVE